MLTPVDAHPVTQGALINTELLRHPGNRTRVLDHHLHGFFLEFRREALLRSGQKPHLSRKSILIDGLSGSLGAPQAAVGSSMACRERACPVAGGDALGQLAGFRRGVYRCLWRRADALFETMDAVLTAGRAGSLPYLSLEPGFRRGHGMVYQGLARGRVDEEALRDLLVAARPRQWPLVFAVDASVYPRPQAGASPGREWHHHACPGRHGSDGAAVAGWAFQWLAQLSFGADSWTAPQDQVRVGAGGDATRQAAAQIVAHAGRLRAGGEAGIPLYVLDAGYDEAPLTWDLREHLDRVQILVRLRSDRVLYRDPDRKSTRLNSSHS